MGKNRNRQVKALGVRGVSAQVVRQVHYNQHSLSQVLPESLANVEGDKHAFVQLLSYGTLRWFFKLDAILKKLLKKQPRAKDNIIYYLLMVGLYQLIFLDKADYVVVKETVSELNALDRTWAKGLINAILRGFIRDREVLMPQIEKQLSLQYAHPQWLINRLNKDYEKSQVKNILQAANQHPPFWLRFNQAKIKQAEYKKLLDEQQLAFDFLDNNYPAIHLNKPIIVDKLPGFSQGLISVQDGAAQCAAHLLDVQKDHRVLDACAAPGGKTSHLLEMYPQMSSLLALDISQTRLEQINSNLTRLDLLDSRVKLLYADAMATEQWWDGQFFDRILLDAPCSATGVIRRHPDIKVLRQDGDIEALKQTQNKILNKLWKILKPGGLLLYATCSILRDENDRQISLFLEQNVDACEKEIVLPWGRAMSRGWQILPGEARLDGFYYAAILKQAEPKNA